jgi:xanthosine utilization system XapX-like protein
VKTNDVWQQFRETPKWVLMVKLLLMFLGVKLVEICWKMPLETSWGRAGYFRAMLGGMTGVLLIIAFDGVRRMLTKKSA